MTSSVLMPLLVTTALIATESAAFAQQPYPGKPIRFISPYAPGGSSSTVARLIGQKLTENWGQHVLVDNRPGGNTIIGTEAMVKATPDGHTILLVTNTHVINSLLIATPYDANRDFAPVATLNSSEYVLVVHPSVPAHSLQELIGLAKSKPGQLNYASSVSGGSNHLVSELFNIMAGVKIHHVPYKGGGPALTDVLGGQVHMFFNNASTFVAHIKSGRLNALAISGAARSPTLPQVPTFTEGGLPGFEVKNWQAVLAPAATPRAIIDKLSAEIGKILTLSDIKEKLALQGMDAFISNPEQFAALLKAETARVAKVIKTANIKLEN